MAERLIDAEAFRKQVEKEIIRLNTNARKYFLENHQKDHITSAVAGAFVIVTDWIDRQPTIEAKPVVHAHWNDDGRCTNCGEHAPWIPFCDDWFESAYCHKCGAQMDEVVE